jgi:sugar phosphate isomerase/epimerase
MYANTSRTRSTKPALLLALVATLAMLLAMVGPPEAGAQGEASPQKADPANCTTGRSLPVSKISIQLYTFNRYIERGIDTQPGAPGPEATRAERLEYVLAFLSEAGYRNIEPYSFHGLTAEQFDALAREYDLKVPSRHMSTNEAAWDANLADAKLLGQRWTGSGGFASPGIGSYENVLATAETLNRLGERSVKNGTGPIFGHNHPGEFTRRYVDAQGDGTLKSAWQILVENTDPRYVTFQLDVGWAVVAGEDPVALVEQFGDRIELFHVKDVVDIGEPTQRQTTVGQGEIDWAALFDVAQGKVKQYVLEQDPPAGAFDPFAFAAESFEYVDCLRF